MEKSTKTSRDRMKRMIAWNNYEARNQPRDDYIANIAGEEIAELEHEYAIKIDHFRNEVIGYINRQAKMLQDYTPQNLGETKLKAFKMAETAKDYGLTNPVKRLNGFCDTITKYLCSHE